MIYGRNAFVLNVATHEMKINQKLSGRFIDSLVGIKDWYYFKTRDRVTRLSKITGETENVTSKDEKIPSGVRYNAKLFESHQRYLYIFGDIWDKQYLCFYKFDTEDNMSIEKCFIHLRGFRKCHWNYFFITQDFPSSDNFTLFYDFHDSNFSHINFKTDPSSLTKYDLQRKHTSFNYSLQYATKQICDSKILLNTKLNVKNYFKIIDKAT